MQTSIITVSLDKSTLTKSLHGYSGAFLDFHIVSRSGGGGLRRGEITKSLGNIYSQDVPTGRPGTSLYDVLQSF